MFVPAMSGCPVHNFKKFLARATHVVVTSFCCHVCMPPPEEHFAKPGCIAVSRPLVRPV